MSLRLIVALVLLVVACIWTMRRPFIGVCVVIILFHLNPRVFGTGLEDIRFQFYATIVLVLSVIVNQYQLKRILTPMHLPMRMMIGFLAVVFLTSLWAAADADLALDSAIDFAKIVLFVYLMTIVVQSEKELKVLIWVMLASVAYTAFMARWGVELGWIKDHEIGIATGGTGTHMMMYFPLLLSMAIIGGKWERRAAFVIMPFVLDALTVLPEGFRSSFVNLVTAAGLYLIFAPGRMRMKGILPIAFGGVLFFYVFAPPGYFEYMLTILNPETDGSSASRAIINDASLQILAENPMGVGYNNYSLVSAEYIPEENLTDQGTRDAHNAYLKVLCEFGFLGFFVWMMMFGAAWFYYQRVRRTLPSGEQPDTLQLFAFALGIGLLGVAPAIYTHSYNDLDTLYWFTGLSAIIYNLKFQEEIRQIAEARKKAPEATKIRTPELTPSPG